MDRVNYFDEYLLGNIDADTLAEKINESIHDGLMYVIGAADCAKYMHDYYKGAEPIYPSEMAMILDEFLESVGLPEDIRKDIGLEETSCFGCVYEDADGSTEDVGNCVCCSRMVDAAKNDYYRKK